MKKLIIWLMALCMLTGCAVQPVATEPTEVQSMAYSNVTPPTLPTWDKSEFPNYALIFVYNVGADVEDWGAVHLLASNSEIYYDTESKCLLTSGTSIYNRYTTTGGAWEGWWDGPYTFSEIPIGLYIIDFENTAINLSTQSVYTRALSPTAIYDTEGNQWLAAGSATPVVTFPDGVSITPEIEIVVKQGEEHEIQCAVTQSGVTLDPKKYTWRVYEGKSVDGGYGLYLTDAVTIDENGLLTVTTNTTTEQRFFVYAIDDVLGMQAWFLRTEAFNLQSFLIGYTLGLAGKPLPLRGKEPIAYLYNGVRLPKLPEWDRGVYPYAAVGGPLTRSGFDGEGYVLILSDEPLTQSGTEDAIADLVSNYLAAYYATTAELAEELGSWSNHPESVAVGNWGTPTYWWGGNSCTKAFWANHDVYNTSGGTPNYVWLAASEPIPVYE